ncbi:helix-turn-helix domain-containing protein [Herbiconiux solani]|uniref:helix-turn-helix domain-containing protein n=1 Tax=Herbiconiux solani TaxID=661329 RepID=UPI000A0519E3|nr:helix-turn-helix transcriptional regulator [Herbiconiux solani]
MGTGGSALSQYLRARRALVTPEEAGIPREPGRRVSGLRRDEVAALTGVSPGYYHRLEQGRDRHPSEQVLLALATVLRLDDFAVEHLFRLAEAESGALVSDETARAQGPVEVADVVDHWVQNPAFVTDGLQTVVASNVLARRLGQGRLDPGQNMVQCWFTDEARSFAPDWEESAARLVAALRFQSDPADPALHRLVARLTAEDDQFADLWARHDARPLGDGFIRFDVPGVGAIDLRYQSLAVPSRRGSALTVFFAEPGTPGAAALAYLMAL